MEHERDNWCAVQVWPKENQVPWWVRNYRDFQQREGSQANWRRLITRQKNALTNSIASA
jgi:hypothetical protein